MSGNKEIFKGKTLPDLFGEIYDNSKKTRGQVKGLISELKVLIGSINDATLVVPLIKEYLEIGVKNDEHLIKLATIIQRIETANSTGSSTELFDPDELQQLLEASEAEQSKIEEKKSNDK